MTQYFGDFEEDATVYIPFNTFDSNDPSASVTITNLADADIKVHKDGGTTQLVTDGATITIDFDSITGNHIAAIDTSAHADYTAGAEYMVRIEGTTVDAATINAWIGSFSIERSGGAIALLKGTNSLANIEDKIDIIDTNVDQIETAVITNAVGADVSADIATAQADLDTITGSDGVTLATAQALYAPNVVVPDAAGVAPTAVENRQEMDSNSTQLAAIVLDTGTTLDGKINTIDSNVDAILLDTAEIGAAGAGLTAINLPNQTMDISGNITGSLSGSVGSVVGHTAQTGDSFAIVNGAAGLVAIDTVVDAIKGFNWVERPIL